MKMNKQIDEEFMEDSDSELEGIDDKLLNPDENSKIKMNPEIYKKAL